MPHPDQSLDAILGQEFLTWLWYISEIAPDMTFQTPAGHSFSVHIEQRVCVQGGEGEYRDTATVSGPLSELKEARMGLSMGKKVTRALVVFEQDEMSWRLTLRADDFALSSLKMPATDQAEKGENEPDARFFERIYLLEESLAMLDVVYKKFLTLRFAPGWDDEVRRVRAWIVPSH